MGPPPVQTAEPSVTAPASPAQPDVRASKDDYECTREVMDSMRGKSNFSFGPLWWVWMQQSRANDETTEQARSLYTKCMRSRGYQVPQ